MIVRNSFKYSDTNKRYHTLDYYYKHKYNSKVFKVSLNIGCSCPNIDGTKDMAVVFIVKMVVVTLLVKSVIL